MRNISKIILGFLAITTLSACNPLKVTDPNDPRFDIKKFRYYDYKYSKDPSKEVAKVLLSHFPKGTDQSYIEEYLVSNDAVVISGSARRLYKYDENNPFISSTTNKEILARKPAYYTIYRFTTEHRLISLTPSSAPTLLSYFDSENKLLFMILNGKILN